MGQSDVTPGFRAWSLGPLRLSLGLLKPLAPVFCCWQGAKWASRNWVTVGVSTIAAAVIGVNVFTLASLMMQLADVSVGKQQEPVLVLEAVLRGGVNIYPIHT